LRMTMAYFPDKPVLKADLGVIYFKAGRYDAALSLLRDAERADHQDSFTNFYLAMLYEKIGKLQEASDLYEKLLVVMPDYTKLYYQLANLKAKLNKEGEGFYYYGFYYFYGGDLANAKHHFSRSISLLPKDSQMKTEAENVLKKIDRFEKEK